MIFIYFISFVIILLAIYKSVEACVKHFEAKKAVRKKRIATIKELEVILITYNSLLRDPKRNRSYRLICSNKKYIQVSKNGIRQTLKFKYIKNDNNIMQNLKDVNSFLENYIKTRNLEISTDLIQYYLEKEKHKTARKSKKIKKTLKATE